MGVTRAPVTKTSVTKTESPRERWRQREKDGEETETRHDRETEAKTERERRSKTAIQRATEIQTEKNVSAVAAPLDGNRKDVMLGVPSVASGRDIPEALLVESLRGVVSSVSVAWNSLVVAVRNRK